MTVGRGNQSRAAADPLEVLPAVDPIARRLRRPGRRFGRRGRLVAPSVVTVAVIALAACGSGSGSGNDLSEAGARGRTIANSNGCGACHGADGQGGVGPKWVGLAGSDVTLADGEVVVADDDYLAQAIADPGAQLVAGFPVQMPENSLSDDEVAAVIAYIHDLSAPADGEAVGADGGGG